jgi:hypothetical protein
VVRVLEIPERLEKTEFDGEDRRLLGGHKYICEVVTSDGTCSYAQTTETSNSGDLKDIPFLLRGTEYGPNLAIPGLDARSPNE